MAPVHSERVSSLDESGIGSARQLRTASMLRRPGRYQEGDSRPTIERPIFIHPEIPFRADLVPHCAFPSLPFDYPGPGPSEIWKAQHPTPAATATGGILHNRQVGSSEDTDDDEHNESSDGNGGHGNNGKPPGHGRRRAVAGLKESRQEDEVDPDETEEERLGEEDDNEETESAVNERPHRATTSISALPGLPQEPQQQRHCSHSAMASERQNDGEGTRHSIDSADNGDNIASQVRTFCRCRPAAC